MQNIKNILKKLEEFIMKLLTKNVEVTYSVVLTAEEANKLKVILDKEVANGDTYIVDLQSDINTILQS